MGRSLKQFKLDREANKGIGQGKRTFVSSSQPSDKNEGDIWYNKTTQIAYIAVENDTTGIVEWKIKSGGSTSTGENNIALTDLSLTTSSEPSGNGALVYNNTTGVFTYTPPDVPSIAPYALSSSIPSALTDLGITDGTNGQVLQTDGAGNFSFIDQQVPNAVTVYSTQASLPMSNNSIGDMAFAEDTDKLFFWNSGWYEIGLVNQTPNISGAESEYQLATDGTPTVVTLTVTDPEGFDVTIGYTTSGLTNEATVSQGTGNNTNVFTITPSTTEADAGTFNITFTATDGINTAAFTSTFNLVFSGSILYDGTEYTSGDVITIPYSGSSKQIQAVGAVDMTVELYGAAGGGSYNDGNQYYTIGALGGGGWGGYIIGNITLTDETVTAYVGGKGSNPTSYASSHRASGGYNGGGNGGSDSDDESGGGGGGATDIRRGGTALSNRIIVAGGGGGGGFSESNTGGAGGGAGGLSPTGLTNPQPGSQTAGGSGTASGSLGIGGNADSGGNGGGGGGGGYYGGGAGGSGSNGAPGAGGSGYHDTSLFSNVSVHTGIGAPTTNRPSNGNGQIKITLL